jgi:hypothetical protein
LRHGLPGRVVYGRAEASSGDDDPGAPQRFTNGLGNAVGVIPDGGGAEQIHAKAAQGASDEAGVGVGGFAEQKLGPDGDDFSGYIIQHYIP